jgi:hypothetical protein
MKKLSNYLSQNNPRLYSDYQESLSLEVAVLKEADEFIKSEMKNRIDDSRYDEIDKVLAEHYGFTEEELDFIINYDIKYRMGKELEGDTEAEISD